ncbi:hypothetical protein TKWG_06785 [Advenella kashmirensis WT001]|uniref:Beta-lactamase hydrolase-like protein phosphatase-like domain-containing protein n=1 Tax=Advenella kashmirensis (strain DSM 17095 / LMG 22695 / WT001) TaxID=1036672 RepID=I3U9V6_ADVKW|nr:TIGR01244 family sulfur transferase [Advenella kashmirensis]AFK61794.1 hypothetical protein TKWG_06785 [Advenella kashmirensis WT001]
MSTPITPLSDSLAVAPNWRRRHGGCQAAGYQSVIINRPDYEGGESQPASADVIKAGEQAGLTVVYQPVVSGAITPEDVKAFRQYLDTLPAPVLAYCRSGTRCTHLYNAAKQETSQS